jgi:hypothetical protein
LPLRVGGQAALSGLADDIDLLLRENLMDALP